MLVPLLCFVFVRFSLCLRAGRRESKSKPKPEHKGDSKFVSLSQSLLASLFSLFVAPHSLVFNSGWRGQARRPQVRNRGREVQARCVPCLDTRSVCASAAGLHRLLARDTVCPCASPARSREDSRHPQAARQFKPHQSLPISFFIVCVRRFDFYQQAMALHGQSPSGTIPFSLSSTGANQQLSTAF